MTRRIEVEIDRRRPFAQGHAFGQTGPYERLDGSVRLAVDPGAPAFRDVVDLDRCPRDADGLVRARADLRILKPRHPDRGNRRLVFGYGNRGNLRELQFFNDAPATNDPIALEHAGNGFLMRRGYAVVWVAWEGDLLPGDGRLVLDLPVARAGDEPITGPVRVEFIAAERGITSLPLSGRAATRSYPAASLDPAQASLTRRRYPAAPPEPVPSSSWSFARVETGAGLDAQGAERAVVPSPEHIHLPDGFEPGWIYELVYTARDPRPHGLGHAVVRDAVSYLRYGDEDDAGAANPLGAGSIERAYAWGRSQTGRCIRDFLHRGYNADAEGRRVFDGVLPHVSGAGLMWMNHRFARVVSPAGQQYEDHRNPADRFPFSYARTTDHVTGRSDAICKRPDTDPLVLHTQSATEYWQRRGSLVHTDTRGADLPQPENVRVYLWCSSQHFASPRPVQPAASVCQNPVNVVRTSMLFRAMLDALDAWATHGIEPPPSRVPLRADATLVPYETWRARFPAIPGVALPSGVNPLPLLDFGPDAAAGHLSREPPAVLDAAAYPTLVPAVDGDGNDVGGVRPPMVEAPLATYTGWNLRARGHGHGAMHEFTGSTLVLPDTPEERAATGDPRRSVRERFPSARDYVAAVEAAARRLVDERLMLEEDVERCVDTAREYAGTAHDRWAPG